MTDRPSDAAVPEPSDAAVDAAAEAIYVKLGKPATNGPWGQESEWLTRNLYRQAARAAVAPLAAERDALAEAVRQLHGFISSELDPDPAPVEDYIIDPATAEAAGRACSDDAALADQEGS